MRWASRWVMRRQPRSLVARALFASVGALLLAMASIGIALTLILTSQQGPFEWEGFVTHARYVRDGMRFDASSRLVSIALAERVGQEYDGLRKDLAFQVLDAHGVERFASDPGPALEALRRLRLQMRDADANDLARISADNVVLRVATTEVDRAGRTYFIRIARSERLASVVRSTGGAIVFAAALGAMVLAILVFSGIILWMARRLAQPLRDVSAAAASIEPGNLTRRLSVHGLPSELVPLIDAFNNALERLAKGYRVQQEFLASAAHELKTPLSLMRAEIEMGSAPNRDLLLKDVDFMARQVHQLLHLAEASEAHNYRFEPQNIGTLLDDAVAYAMRLAEQQDVRIALIRPEAQPMIEADQGALFILWKNLIENAIHHSSPGGVITVRLDRDGFTVADTGPGVAPDDVQKLFTRFWRSAKPRYEGAGMGLAICKEIALAHGWKLSHRHAEAGAGAEFRVAF